MTPRRTPLSRERVFEAALAFADEWGLEKLSMRRLGQELGVEAMSLYNHVTNKDDILDGIVDLVVSEFSPPGEDVPWREGLRETAGSVRRALLRHPWAAALVESRVTPSRVRFRHSEAVIRTLREAGFSNEQAYRAQLTLSSYVYGFALQEVCWPFEPDQRQDIAATLQPLMTPDEHPHLLEMLSWISTNRFSVSERKDGAAYAPDFEFGLDLILDGLETLTRT